MSSAPAPRELVKVKLDPNGDTGSHGHVSQSLVVVKTGQISMYKPGVRPASPTAILSVDAA